MRTIEKRQEMKPIEMKLARRLGGVGIGSPDRPPHPDVIGTLAAEAAKPGNHGYQPYKGAAVLREAFALWYKERYGVALDPEGEILPLIGSKEGVMHVCMTYLRTAFCATTVRRACWPRPERRKWRSSSIR